MNTKKTFYSTIDYLIDDDFINHVINGTPYRRSKEKNAAYMEARSILLADSNVDCGYDSVEIFHLKGRVFSTVGLRMDA